MISYLYHTILDVVNTFLIFIAADCRRFSLQFTGEWAPPIFTMF